MTTALIGGDWGTSNLRVFRYDSAGAVAEVRSAPTGIMAVPAGGFPAALKALTADWLDGGAPILLCGMVGSRQGWVEAPYAACPADGAAVARHAIRAACDFAEVRILPGLSTVHPDGRHDVLRGEETQIFGALPADAGPQLIVTPGTHSKWAVVGDGRVTGFSTYMTGELFAVLKAHSILGRLMQGEAHDADAFALGARRAKADPALSRLLFSVRAEGLFDAIPATGLAAYLSGLLIGAEVSAGLAAASPAELAGGVSLIGEPALTDLYAQALDIAGADVVTRVSGEAAVGAGLWRLAGALGLSR